ncbi:MAG TPA: class I SAM-dependent methyltransferase [Stellaceae bacterium]|nr:class I SAM-dependent methyltransferase [Stellaceae bacterium]
MTEHERTAEIRAHWTEAARHELDADGARPTARDPNLQEAVEGAIERFLSRGQSLLDIGCGDGLSTLRFARSVESALGLDYVDAFVSRARTRAAADGIANAAFETGDVLSLGSVRARHGTFDVVTTIRCLINLASSSDQARAVGEIAALVKPGGLYLASEGWSEGMEGLNLARRRAGLASIEVAKYNLLLSRADFEVEAAKHFDLVDYVGLGFFLFVSRVLQPLLVAPERPSHFHPLNKVGLEVEQRCLVGRQFDFCDYAGLYVFRRRAS